MPPLLLFVVVIGSIYAGIATPTESAALGVVAALVLAAAHRRLTWQVIRVASEGTMRTTALVLLIFTAAFFLNFVISAIGLTNQINNFILRLGWTPLQTMIAVIVFYLILGCFMETMAMMITTIPIIAPVIFKLGYDPVRFGIIIIILVETAMITPPVGVNLFIVQGVRGQGRAERRDRRRLAVRHHDDRDDGAADRVPGHRAVAAAPMELVAEGDDQA